MFSGSSSPPKEKADPISPTGSDISTSPNEKTNPVPTGSDTNAVAISSTEESAASQKKLSPPSTSLFRRSSGEQSTQSASAGAGGKRRRSSTVAKAANFFSNAKNSLSLSNSRESPGGNGLQFPSNPLQKLGRMDPALSVPQGSFNNSAGESLPSPQSSFRIGVTEDRNRKCRRTMEDTHAYLYNFLGTPAPSEESEVNGKESSSATDVSTSSEELPNAVETDNGYFAIFDGHAGTFAAEWCGKKLHLILEDVMRRNPNAPVPELLDQTFTWVDQHLEKLPLKNSGCTAVIALLRWEDRVASNQAATGSSALPPAAAATKEEDPESAVTPTQAAPSTTQPSATPKLQQKAVRQRVLYTANVGDARIVLCRNGKALRLSYDHKGSDENEGKRISNAGGLILNNRVNGVLAVTRALGDAYLKDLVTGHPYTTETVIQPDPDEFIILACDGLWDVCSDQEAVDLVRNVPDAQEASKILVDHALSRFSTDNLSCMVIRLDAERIKEVVSQAAEPTGGDGGPRPKVDHGMSEADKIVEGARRSMQSAGLTDDTEAAEKVNEEILQKMSNDEPGPELSVDEHSDVPEVVKTDADADADAGTDNKSS